MAERSDYAEVLLPARLRAALARLNPGPSAVRARRRLPQADATRGLNARSPQPRFPPHAHRRRDGGVSRRRHVIRGAPARVIDFEHARRERLARRQPVHGRREQPPAPARHRAVRQRPPAGRDRTEESDGRKRHRLDRMAAVADLQVGAAGAVRHERRPDRVRRRGCAHRHAHGRSRVVQALADDLRRDPGRCQCTRVAGDAGRRLRPTPLSSPSCATSSPSRTTAALWPRRWPATTSSMPSRPRSPRRYARWSFNTSFTIPGDATSPAATPAAKPATAASASSGTPRARARA